MNFDEALKSHISTVFALDKDIIKTICDLVINTLRSGGKIIWMGNGGSAADSQHLAAELVGRFKKERAGLPSIALTTDTSIITAIANDYGFDVVFERQIESLCMPNDLVIGISTSGNSTNVVRAIQKAKQKGATVVALTGGSGGELKQIADITLIVNSSNTARIQECHILVGHIICEAVDEHFA